MENATTSVDSVPQWKKDLIARLRNQNKTSFGNGRDHHSTPHHSSDHRTVLQPNLTSKSESVASDVSPRSIGTDASEQQCNVNPKMVQERVWVDNKPDHFAEMVANNGYHKDSDSDSSEELHYGPGIVKKLKNKYLSLALRESNNRPSILHMRKATSLENLLDDDESEIKQANDQYEPRLNGVATRNIPNRYRNTNRHHEIKRARSVETISRLDSQTNNVVTNRQSLHEEMLIAAAKEGSDYPYRKINDNGDVKTENKFSHRINRPKRLQPIMSEKEKPPVDFVKQAKMIFERRAEQRTKAPPQTGDVAAKVDSFNNIIVKAKVEAKVARKPQIKSAKPTLSDKKVSNNRPQLKISTKTEEKLPTKPLELNKVPKNDLPLLSPIPDVSRILPGESERGKTTSNLSETPDLILTSSPLTSLLSPTSKKSPEQFIKEEHHGPKKLTSPLLSPNRVKPASPLVSPSYSWPISPSSPSSSPTKLRPTTLNYDEDGDFTGYKKVSPTSINNISKDSSAAVYNFVNRKASQEHLPVNKNVSEEKVPPSEPLKIEVNGHADSKSNSDVIKLLQTQRPRSPPKFTPPPPPVSIVDKKIEKSLTVTEIEKNSINTAKNKSSDSGNERVEVVNKNVVPKKQPRVKEPVSNTAVFNFVSSKRDVPDYISNDMSRMPSRPELPKPGEGGIILIPGATILESFTDEDEEILRSLEGPPSPCDVTFINDNILIDGKSSLCQKTKRAKLKISFVDAGPDVYEYPSETSLMIDDSPLLSPVQLGHTVPNLSGSSLANYTPKSTEAFQPGVSRSVPQMTHSSPIKSASVDVTETEPNRELDEIDKPFSSGHNADILF